MQFKVTLIILNKKTKQNLVLYCDSHERRGTDIVLDFGSHSVAYPDKLIKTITKNK